MAKSGDDLMRWQSIARARRAEVLQGRKHTLSINRTCWVSQRVVRIMNDVRNDLNGQCFEMFGGFGHEWRLGGL